MIFFQERMGVNRLQVQQNKCMRNILKMDRFTSTEILTEILEIMNVKQIILYRTLIFVHNIVNNYAPQYLTRKITYRSEDHNLNLRTNNQISLINATKACSQNSLFFKGIKLFNNLPLEIREEKNYKIYDEKLKIYIRSNH